MYQFIIPNKKTKIYLAFACGIIILNLIGFTISNSNFLHSLSSIWPVLAGSIIIILFLFYKYSHEKRLQMAGTAILIAGIFWMGKGLYQLFFINLLLWGMYTIARRMLIVRVNTQNISYPSFPPKSISWSNVNNIILKDDILTIDLKNNKIYQHLIEYADKEADEAEFNDFCKKQLMVNGS